MQKFVSKVEQAAIDKTKLTLESDPDFCKARLLVSCSVVNRRLEDPDEAIENEAKENCF
jgi:hypothetical protein